MTWFKRPFLVLRPLQVIPLAPVRERARAMVILEGGIGRPHWRIFRFSDAQLGKAKAAVQAKVDKFMQEHGCKGTRPVDSIPDCGVNDGICSCLSQRVPEGAEFDSERFSLE